MVTISSLLITFAKFELRSSKDGLVFKIMIDRLNKLQPRKMAEEYGLGFIDLEERQVHEPLIKPEQCTCKMVHPQLADDLEIMTCHEWIPFKSEIILMNLCQVLHHLQCTGEKPYLTVRGTVYQFSGVNGCGLCCGLLMEREDKAKILLSPKYWNLQTRHMTLYNSVDVNMISDIRYLLQWPTFAHSKLDLPIELVKHYEFNWLYDVKYALNMLLERIVAGSAALVGTYILKNPQFKDRLCNSYGELNRKWFNDKKARITDPEITDMTAWSDKFVFGNMKHAPLRVKIWGELNWCFVGQNLTYVPIEPTLNWHALEQLHFLTKNDMIDLQVWNLVGSNDNTFEEIGRAHV